ncbi:hypothetical protein Tco_0992984 [Tanacetum coccineum]|uniref:Uncharacterized protein n=1 Tax=Tanacetum coccineum TaxID=301880 RepID=A0ABQ5F511_9ASTR
MKNNSNHPQGSHLHHHYLHNPLHHPLHQTQFNLPMRQRRLFLCPHDSPIHVVHSHGSAEGSVQQHDLMVLVTKLNDRIDGLQKDLLQTKKTYSTALTKLVLRVKKLESKLKSGKARRKAKIEEEVHEKPSDETEVIVQEETPTKIIEEHGSGEKCEMEISTANIQVSIASPPKVSTAVPHVYTRRSAKDKGKLSMDEELARKLEEEEEDQFNADKTRALQEEEEERLNMEAARELQRQLDQRQDNKPVSIAQARRNMITYLKNQGGYKESYFKKMSYNDIRPILWDHVNTFIPIGSEKNTCQEEEQVTNKGQNSSRETEEKKKEIADYEEEKDELRMWLAVVPDEEEFVDPEILHTKFPIVDWESQNLGNMHVYKIIRADGNTSYHKTFESMLKSFDRHDLEVLHRLVMERFQDNTPEGYNLMLWGDLKILVDPEQDDDIWKNQNQWKIISWKLYETCGVHTLMVDGTLMTIHMFVEKKYPLTKETLQKMLNWKLEAEAESSMAFELLKFIKTQIEDQ